MNEKDNRESHLTDEQRREIIKRRKKKARNRKILFITAEVVLGIIVAVCAVLLHFLGRIGQNYQVIDENAKYVPSYGTSTAAEVADNETAAQNQTETSISEGGEVVIVIPTTAETTTVEEEVIPTTARPTSEYTTFCIFGVDARAGYAVTDYGANSDVLIVATLNNYTGEIRMASIYRDALLKQYSSQKYDKANAAYSHYGLVEAMNTLAYNLDITFDYYVAVDWAAAVKIIAVLGGVDVEMKAAYKQIKDDTSETGYVPYLNGLINEIVENTGIGTTPIPDEAFVDGLIYHLDGVQAVAYMRLRRTDSDFNRTQRQRAVITQALELAKKANFSTLVSMIDIVGENMAFDISQDEILGLLAGVANYSIVDSMGYPFHLYDGSGYSGAMHYNITTVDVIANVTTLHQRLYPDVEYYPSDVIYQINEEMRALGQFDENWNLNIQ
ncbi:MAG: LCP family protein [Lachnospiraceae bacterium]|nr:LCP family protein [Lachnospiraceae bacterium]